MDLTTAEAAFDNGGISPSRVSRLADGTISHLLHATENPTPATREMIIGTAVHALLLLGEDWEGAVTVADKPVLGGKGVTNEIRDQRKAEWEASQEDAKKEHKTLIGTAEFEEAAKMAARLAGLFTRTLMENEFSLAWCDHELHTEQKIGWVDEGAGVPCHGIIDGLSFDGTFLADIKTTKDAGVEAFSREIFSKKYHIKCAMYADAVKTLTGIAPRVWLPVVENHGTYEPRMYELHELALEDGRRTYRRCLETWQRYLDAPDDWCGYPLKASQISIPRWAMGRLA